MANENEGVQTTAETTEQTKYLDKAGLTTFWGKVKALVTAAVGTMNDAITGHTSRKDNPHGVTKAQVGLGNVDNVKQIPYSEKGAKSGVATLDANGKIPVEQLGNLDTSLYVIVDTLPTMGQKTNKIYLVKNMTKPGNVYTEYAWVNNAWETLGDFSSDVDLKPYAKLDGGNTFTGAQTFKQASDSTTSVYIESGHVQVSGDDTDLTITDSGIKVTDGSATEVFNTNGGTVDMKEYVGKTTYNTDKTNLTNAVNGKLDKTGGTITGNLNVTGTLSKGGKAVLTDHQAIHKLTIQKNGSAAGTFNPTSADATINITVPTKMSELSDDVVNGKYLPLSGGNVVGDTTFKASANGTKTVITTDGVSIGGTEYQAMSILPNNDITKELNFPSKGGTFALTSDIPSITGKADKSYVDGELEKYFPLSGGSYGDDGDKKYILEPGHFALQGDPTTLDGDYGLVDISTDGNSASLSVVSLDKNGMTIGGAALSTDAGVQIFLQKGIDYGNLFVLNPDSIQLSRVYSDGNSEELGTILIPEASGTLALKEDFERISDEEITAICV